MMETYRYYSRFRPVGIGTCPNGFTDFKNFGEREIIKSIDCMAWGYVEYKEPLTCEDEEVYDLVPDAPVWHCVTTSMGDYGITVFRNEHYDIRSFIQPQDTFELKDFGVFSIRARHSVWYSSETDAQAAAGGGTKKLTWAECYEILEHILEQTDESNIGALTRCNTLVHTFHKIMEAQDDE